MKTTSFAKTLTGDFLIGYRSGDGSWQKNLDDVLAWAIANRFGTIDVPASRLDEIGKLAAHDVQPGTVDLMVWPGFQNLLSPDKAKRTGAVETARANIEKGAKAGAKIFFTLMLPEDFSLPRAENFKYMIESYAAIATTLDKCGAKLAVEGWPGPGALCCTPETYRALFREIPSRAMGVNYDPSHLIRMGIDPIRFLREFVDRVHHVHAKDTEINSDNLYEFGHEQPGTFTPSPAYGAWAWRYTIPGHGITRWPAVLQVLRETNYSGKLSIELEDARFNDGEKSEKLGLVKAREFLEGC